MDENNNNKKIEVNHPKIEGNGSATRNKNFDKKIGSERRVPLS